MAAASTKDALQFVLRSGMKCFDHPDNRRRLADHDADEFKALLAELRTWPGGRHWLRTWPETELRELTALWRRERGVRESWANEAPQV
jgi:hypothetical protein